MEPSPCLRPSELFGCLLIAGGARTPGATEAFDFAPIEAGLKHAGLVLLDLCRTVLRLDLPTLELGAQSFGIGGVFSWCRARSSRPGAVHEQLLTTRLVGLTKSQTSPLLEIQMQ